MREVSEEVVSVFNPLDCVLNLVFAAAATQLQVMPLFLLFQATAMTLQLLKRATLKKSLLIQ